MNKTLNYKDYAKRLHKNGYECTFYGDTRSGNGLAYFETEAHVLRIEHLWNKASHGRYVAGKIVKIEDVTECHR